MMKKLQFSSLLLLLMLIGLLPGCNDAVIRRSSDVTPPTVSSVVPEHLSTEVPLNSRILATFSEAMNPATITTTSFTLRQGTVTVAATTAYTGVTATLTPAANLLPDTHYTATITTAAQDLAGNALVVDYVWTFTTGTAVDTTRPTVSAVVPENLATDAPINTAVTATFSEAMNPLSITTATFTLEGDDPVTGTVTYAGVTATFTPDADLTPDTLYTGMITTAVEDLAGNTLALNYVWTFTTGAAPDTTAPVVSSVHPANLAINVPFNTAVTATFSEAMNPLTITTASFTLAGLAPVLGTVTYAGTTATFTPNADLLPATVYTATITTFAKDLAGNALAVNYVWTFTTGDAPDTTRPTVISVVPANLATNVPVNSAVTATFSEAMNPLSITTASFTLVGTGTVTGTVTYAGTTATFTPNVNLAQFTLHTATITTAVRDLAGNTLNVNYVWTFTTGIAPDTTRPTVISVVPGNLNTNVPINSAVTATFSEAMDPLSITTASFTLAGTGPVTGTVTYAGNTATFTPNTAMAPNTLHTATITTAAEDLAGNNLAVNYVWTFTTGAAPDTLRPTVISNFPLNLAVDVPVTTELSAEFSEAMEPLTITELSFTLEGLGPVTGSVSYLGTTATFVPDVALEFDTEYTATITTMAEDLAGNALAVDHVWTFTTGAELVGLLPVELGELAHFAVIAGYAITCVPPCTITGDVGISPAAESWITGFSQVDYTGYALSPQVTGFIYAADMAEPTPTMLTTAKGDLTAAYNDAAGRTPVPTGPFLNPGSGNLAGLNLVPGLYKFTGEAMASTDFTLTGSATDVWIFQIGTTLTIANNIHMILAGGAQAKNIFWQVGTQATLGTDCIFFGNLFAEASITMETGSTLNGRALAFTGTVAMDQCFINIPAL